VRVAIYTDASIVKSGRGAWATVIVRPDVEHVEAAGQLRGLFRSSAAVEGAAIANALWYARQHGLIAPGDAVELRCDNRAIVDRIAAAYYGRRMRDAKDGAIMAATNHILATADTLKLELHAGWVKGHQKLDSADPHAIWNIRCDQLCSAVRDGRKPHPFHVLRESIATRQARRLRKERATL
jgi:ribonuclease HI